MNNNEPADLPLVDRDLHLVELVNRVLDRGAVITGEVTISVAGIDLVYLGLQLVIAAAETAKGRSPLSGRLNR
ncbi:MAG TPA: gas vesicle protein [Longimicrobiales bacterium]